MKNSGKYLQIAAYLFLIFIFVICIGIARNCARVPYMAREGNSGGDTIDVALVFAPGSFYNQGDSISGINHEVALTWQTQTDKVLKFWPVTEPADALEKLSKGSFNILASLPLDHSLKKNFPVSESIFLDRLVLVQLADSAGNKPVNSSLDLNNREVYVTAGSSAENRLRNLSEEIGGKIVIKDEPGMSDELLTLQVANGSIPLAVVNERVAKRIAREYPLLNYDSTVSFTQFQVWVFNPSDSILCKEFNLWFESFRDTPGYREILEK